MTRTRLLHVSANRYPPFPAEHSTRAIWDELARGFDEFHLVARSETNRYVYSVEGNLHLHLLPSLGRRNWVFMLLSWALPYFMMRLRPTHLIAQCPVQGGLSAAACAKVFRVPLFLELHGDHYFGKARPGWLGGVEHAVYRALSPPVFGAATKIRSLSDDMSDRIAEVYGESLRGKVVTIPTRVDLSVFAEAKASYGTGPDLRIITVGSYVPRKNHLRMIEDFHEAGIPFRLTIVGSGPLESEYISRARSLGIADRIEVAGQKSHAELAAMLAAHDVYVHYSLSEGLARAILEAMAAGLPVVATRAGFVRGVLESGENSLLLESPDGAQLGDAIRSLAESESLRERLGSAARKTIEERFEWNRVFDSYRNEILRCATD